MERPKVTYTPRERAVTGEIMYFNDMRRLNEHPDDYTNLSDMAIQMYEMEAAAYQESDMRPAILDTLEQYDDKLTDTEASCLALADELLALRDEDSRWTFVDIAVSQPAEEVMAMLQAAGLGRALAADDEQLAIESDGAYYPVLDAKKVGARLVGVGLRVWGWDDKKYVFTNGPDELFDHKKHILRYPGNETIARRQVELQFSYITANDISVSESISLHIDSHTGSSIHRSIWMPAYAETGYEGHGGAELDDCSDTDVAAFGDLVARIVGDVPESMQMHNERLLRELTEKVATPEASAAIQRLIDATWPAQALHILMLRMKESGMTVGESLCDGVSVAAGIEAIDKVMRAWNEKRS